jgi:hypothetical protein
MSKVIKRKDGGVSVERTVGKDNKDCPRTNLLKDIGIGIGDRINVIWYEKKNIIVIEKVKQDE